MEKKLYEEMLDNVNKLEAVTDLSSKTILLFGHCNATLELIDLLESKGLKTVAILDNSAVKEGLEYKEAVVINPMNIGEYVGDNHETDSIVLITSRFYASMLQQLREIGYKGKVRKVIDYNTYADYSLSEETISRMKIRERQGNDLLQKLYEKYDECFKVFCPFNAIGDVYFMMSYWEAFAKERVIKREVFCVLNNELVDVIRMFGDYPVEVYSQRDLDEMVQSVIFTKDENSFIAHQDRPYVVNLSYALYIKKIPLEKIYCCGVYGLPEDTLSTKPRSDLPIYKDIASIPEGKSVIFSPYAKSVIAINPKVWKDAVNYYTDKGFKCYTNVVGDEKTLEGTEAISPSLLELRSVVEKAGTFIGIRSGLCDILREANAKKIAIYPDYNYCDTKWKAIEMYYIEQFDYNLLATEEIIWENL